MNTEPQKDLHALSLEQLVELLIDKTAQLLEAKENKLDGNQFQNLLVEVEQLNAVIKSRREENNSKNL